MRDHGDGVGGTGFTEAEDDLTTALRNREITTLCLGTGSVVCEHHKLAWPWLPCFHLRHRGVYRGGSIATPGRQTHALDGGFSSLVPDGPFVEGVDYEIRG